MSLFFPQAFLVSDIWPIILGNSDSLGEGSEGYNRGRKGVGGGGGNMKIGQKMMTESQKDGTVSQCQANAWNRFACRGASLIEIKEHFWACKLCTRIITKRKDGIVDVEKILMLKS